MLRWARRNLTLFSFLRAQTPPLLLFLIEMRAILKGAR